MRIVLTTLLLLFATAAMAQTRYVDDNLTITMRTGKANTFKIVRTLKSGAVLEVLEEDGEYTRVRASDGAEGWVLTQYLSNTPIAKQRLARAEQQLAGVRQENQKLQQQLAALREEKTTVEQERSGLDTEAEELRRELAELREVAARPVELAQENKTLTDKLVRTQNELEQLQHETERLKDRSQREWFITGAGVLGGGIFLGLILPMLRRRKKAGMFD